ncbi:signal-induced proliferation-associated 1-like protein 3, partial [Lates japonicus]
MAALNGRSTSATWLRTRQQPPLDSAGKLNLISLLLAQRQRRAELGPAGPSPGGSGPGLAEVGLPLSWVYRLNLLTIGCEGSGYDSEERNGLGQLGFHVRLGGTVAEFLLGGGMRLLPGRRRLRQGSGLVEISARWHDDASRADDDLQGRQSRGCTEEYEMKTMEQKPEPEPLAAGYRPSPRPTWRWDSPPIPPGLHSTPNPQRWAPMGPPPPPLPRSHKALMPVPYREPQHLNSKRPVSYPENHYTLSPAGGDRVLPYRNPSASFSSPSSGLIGLSTMGPPGITPGPFVRYKHSPDRYGTGQRPLLPYEPHLSVDITSSGESSSGFTSQESTIERCKT